MKNKFIFIICIIAFFALAYIGLKKWQQVPHSNASGDIISAFEPSQSSANVVAGDVGIQVVNDRLNSIGTGRAQASVDVKPWTNGMMVKLFVKAGDRVNAQDPIAELDSDNEKIAVDRAKIQLNDAQLALTRTMKLRATNTASEVQEISATLTLENAKLALRDSQLALERRTVRAPINGVVGILPIDAGNYVTSETTITRIDNRDKILVDVWVPERFSPLINVGDEITATSIARPGDVFKGKINAIDNMIDEQSRTLRVRGEINNEKDVLRAGMSFAVTLKFPGDPYSTVNPLAIQWQAEGAYVWLIEKDVVKRVPVTIIQRSALAVLVKGELSKGDKIVIQGVQNLQEGSHVTILKSGADHMQQAL